MFGGWVEVDVGDPFDPIDAALAGGDKAEGKAVAVG